MYNCTIAHEALTKCWVFAKATADPRGSHRGRCAAPTLVGTMGCSAHQTLRGTAAERCFDERRADADYSDKLDPSSWRNMMYLRTAYAYVYNSVYRHIFYNYIYIYIYIM